MSYRLTLALYQDDPELMPTVVAAYDEYTAEAWGGEPDFYEAEVKKYHNGTVRELVVLIPTEAVEALFAVPEVTASVARAGDDAS